MRSIFQVLDWIHKGEYDETDVDFAESYLTKSFNESRINRRTFNYYVKLLNGARKELLERPQSLDE